MSRWVVVIILGACSTHAVAPPPIVPVDDEDDERVVRVDVAVDDAGAPAVARCVAHGDLPDPSCTPGAIATTDLDVICHHSTRERRHVTETTKRAVLEAYGLSRDAGELEVDHIVPLCLGGSNDIANLWPEPAPRYRDKDRVEASLCRRVCRGDMRLEDAQRIMMTDWRLGE